VSFNRDVERTHVVERRPLLDEIRGARVDGARVSTEFDARMNIRR
jgi:hypothetical protein